MLPNPAVVLKATVRSDLFLLELPERQELLQPLGNLDEPHRICRRLRSAIFAEAEHARAHSIEANLVFW